MAKGIQVLFRQTSCCLQSLSNPLTPQAAQVWVQQVPVACRSQCRWFVYLVQFRLKDFYNALGTHSLDPPRLRIIRFQISPTFLAWSTSRVPSLTEKTISGNIGNMSEKCCRRASMSTTKMTRTGYQSNF